MKKNSTKERILMAPLTRILLGLIVCFTVFIIAQQLTGKLLDLIVSEKNARNLIKGILSSVAVIFAYTFFYKNYEKREITEFSIKGISKYIVIGIGIGVLLQSLTILVIMVNGDFKIVAKNPVSYMIIPFTIAFTVAIFEEIVIRGIIFRIVEEKLGSYISLFITAIIFGALHAANPNSNVMSGVCVGIEAGILMGAAYIYARNLWFPIAIHTSWNFIQSGIFGAVTSGNENTSSYLSTKITGNPLITGGEFGPEGTIQAIIFCVLAAIMLLQLSKNKIISPYWRK